MPTAIAIKRKEATKKLVTRTLKAVRSNSLEIRQCGAEWCIFDNDADEIIIGGFDCELEVRQMLGIIGHWASENAMLKMMDKWPIRPDAEISEQ